jgi:hypothetical protein
VDVRFKEWLIKDTATWTAEQKQSALDILQNDPERMVQILVDNMQEWATTFTTSTGIVVVDSWDEAAARELMEAYRAHFASELESG